MLAKIFTIFFGIWSQLLSLYQKYDYDPRALFAITRRSLGVLDRTDPKLLIAENIKNCDEKTWTTLYSYNSYRAP